MQTRILYLLLISQLSFISACDQEPEQRPQKGAVKVIDPKEYVKDHNEYIDKLTNPALYVKNSDTLIAGNTPQSPYQLADQEKFTKILSSQSNQLIVAPCAVVPTLYGFDWIERSLISQVISAYIHKHTDISVVNPEFIERAIGERKRQITNEEIENLAKKINADSYISCRIGHDSNYKMTITLSKHLLNKYEHSKHEYSISDILFSDIDLPHRIIQSRLPEVIKSLHIDNNTDNVSQYSSESFQMHDDSLEYFSIPENDWLDLLPIDFIRSNGKSSTENIIKLQFLGSLYPSVPQRGRERIFIRALITAYNLPKNNQYKDLLIAQALYYLHRRPAALHSLGKPDSPEDRALYSILNGNLVELETHVEHVQHELIRMMYQLEMFNIQYQYRAMPDRVLNAKIDSLIEQYPKWALLLKRKAAEYNLWRRINAVEIKKELDENLPLNGYHLDELIAGDVALLDPFNTKSNIKTIVNNHLSKLFSDQRRWKNLSMTEIPNEMDLLNLYDSVTEASLLSEINFYSNIQGVPTAALELFNEIDVFYKGHPDFAERKMEALIKKADNSQEHERNRLLQAATQESDNTILWSYGDSYSARQASIVRPILPTKEYSLLRMNQFKLLAKEYPLKWYSSSWSDGGQSDNIERNFRIILENTAWQFLFIERYLYNKIELQQNKQEIYSIFDILESRFSGNGDLIALKSKLLIIDGKENEAIKILSDAASNKPNIWDIFYQLAILHIEQGNYERAFKSLMQYPGFEEPDKQSSVRVSQLAYQAGSMFYWKGMFDYAVPLYQISIHAGSGSGGNMISAIHLATLDMDYQKAAYLTFDLHDRYPSVNSLSSYISYLHAFGYKTEAWSAFNISINKYKKPDLWRSAFVGNRIDNIQDKDFQLWLKEIYKNRNNTYLHSNESKFAIMHYIIDRELPDNFIELIGSLENHVITKVHEEADWVSREDELSKNIILGPAKFIQENELIHGQNVESELVMYARAYKALRKQSYNDAYTEFLNMAGYYYIPKWMWSYFALAATKSGYSAEIRTYLKDELERRGKDFSFDFHLSMALIESFDNNISDSKSHLDDAFNFMPYQNTRPISPSYQWIEICEQLYIDTRDESFKTLLVSWSKKRQILSPYTSWAYTINAQYTDDKQERVKSLAFALYLDPLSIRLDKFTKEDITSAKTFFAKHNPFIVKDTAQDIAI